MSDIYNSTPIRQFSVQEGYQLKQYVLQQLINLDYSPKALAPYMWPSNAERKAREDGVNRSYDEYIKGVKDQNAMLNSQVNFTNDPQMKQEIERIEQNRANALKYIAISMESKSIAQAIALRDQTLKEQLMVAEWLIANGNPNHYNQEELNDIFFEAVDRQDMNGVAQALKIGANPNAKCDEHGHTVLHIVAFNNKLEMLKLLLTSGADINTKDNQGITTLHIAVVTDQFAMVKLLLEKGANVHAKDASGTSALDCAVAKGNLGTVKLLLEKGANIKGDTILLVATSSKIDDLIMKKSPKEIEDFKEIIKLLVSKGADFSSLQPKLAELGVAFPAIEKVDNAHQQELSSGDAHDIVKSSLVDELKVDTTNSE